VTGRTVGFTLLLASLFIEGTVFPVSFPRCLRVGSNRDPAQREVRQYRDRGIEVDHFPECEDSGILGTRCAPSVELPGTIIGIMADPEDRCANFDDLTRREDRGVFCITKAPVAHHVPCLANAMALSGRRSRPAPAAG